MKEKIKQKDINSCAISNLNFFNQILNKYFLLKRQGPFPSLIFKKINDRTRTNNLIYYNYHSLIKNYLNIYFRISNYLALKLRPPLLRVISSSIYKDMEKKYLVPRFTIYQYSAQLKLSMTHFLPWPSLQEGKSPIKQSQDTQSLVAIYSKEFRYHISNRFRNLNQHLIIKPMKVLSKWKINIKSQQIKNPISRKVDEMNQSTKITFLKINNLKLETKNSHLSFSQIRNKHLFFANIQRFEREIKDIKKTVLETRKELYREVHSLKSIKDVIERHINNHYDVNLLVDKVFDELRRRIRLERERRGL